MLGVTSGSVVLGADGAYFDEARRRWPYLTNRNGIGTHANERKARTKEIERHTPL